MKTFILILFSVSILFSKNDKIKYGGEKIEKDKYVTIEVIEKEYDSDAKFQYWNYATGEWIEVTNNSFTKSNSTYKWKPTEKILQKKNLRIRLIDKNNKIMYMSPSYILPAESGSGKQIFQTESAVESNSFKIYPNPVKDKTINIVSERANTEVQSIKIIDMTGLTLFEVNNIEISGNYNMHLPNITKGAYIVQITTAEEVETKKIIIE